MVFGLIVDFLKCAKLKLVAERKKAAHSRGMVVLLRAVVFSNMA